ncbi:MAG TPA: glutathione S-transferase family protein [Xanthobacteraceae bacterium]|nr:glutathione S-transferase family protein [Xanthobacteraceae bacterium]
MKLHWSPRSPYVRKVMVAAHETGVVERLDCVRTVAAMATPHKELMLDNPLSKIPTLVLDDGSRLYDSVVICEYFDALHDGPKLFPSEPRARWTALRRHALGNGLLDVLIYWRSERLREQPAQAYLDAYAVKQRATADALEKEAAALAATPFGIGHIAIGCALSYSDFRFPDIDWRRDHPALAEWHAAFSQRPSVRATAFAEG